MTLRITKDEYRLLLVLLQESLTGIGIKKLQKMSLPKCYSKEKFYSLMEKILEQGEIQKQNTDISDEYELNDKDNEYITKMLSDVGITLEEAMDIMISDT